MIRARRRRLSFLAAVLPYGEPHFPEVRFFAVFYDHSQTREEFAMKKAMCGTGQIAGCRFTLYPMSDRFVELILGALEATDLSKVWSKTDEVSTCVRARRSMCSMWWNRSFSTALSPASIPC